MHSILIVQMSMHFDYLQVQMGFKKPKSLGEYSHYFIQACIHNCGAPCTVKEIIADHQSMLKHMEENFTKLFVVASKIFHSNVTDTIICQMHKYHIKAAAHLQ